MMELFSINVDRHKNIFFFGIVLSTQVCRLFPEDLYIFLQGIQLFFNGVINNYADSVLVFWFDISQH